MTICFAIGEKLIIYMMTLNNGTPFSKQTVMVINLLDDFYT